MSEEKIQAWVIRVDDECMPYEDCSYAYAIVIGTEQEAEDEIADIEKARPNSWVFKSSPIPKSRITLGVSQAHRYDEPAREICS